MSLSPATKSSSRLLSLDMLRGYFIVVIIIDHLWKFPSLFSLISGKALLWMTAAEGFVIISGFLIGYIRGFKDKNKPFSQVAKKLLKRSLVLYLTMIVASAVYVAIEWSDTVPAMPYTPVPNAIRDWGIIFTRLITLEQPHVWVHFLALYARYLLLAVGAIWLIRKNKTWLLAVISLVLYSWGVIAQIQWLQWQVLFFIPSIAGYYFDYIRNWWRHITVKQRTRIELSLLVYFIVSLTLSILHAFWTGFYSPDISSLFTEQFAIALMGPARVINAFLWFGFFALLFQRITPWLSRWTKGVVELLGTHSLQAYIVHGLIICLISLLLPPSQSWLVNTVYGFLAIMGVYWLLRLPVIKTVIPR